jgi:L-lactate utilization protein LutC
MTTRETVLRRVRQAVEEGNRAGVAGPLPERRGVGYQGAGSDAIGRFCSELKTAGGHPHVATDRESAAGLAVDLIRSRGARKVVLSRCPLVDELKLAERLSNCGIENMVVDHLPATRAQEAFFGADVGVSGVYRLVAETGSMVMATSPSETRSVSLLPPIHIALAEANQLVPDLFDLFDLFSPVPSANQSLPPSCLTLITGPSKTGDIELRLVTGVHGPGEVHVIVCSA